MVIFDPLKMDGRADGNQKKAFPYQKEVIHDALLAEGGLNVIVEREGEGPTLWVALSFI